MNKPTKSQLSEAIAELKFQNDVLKHHLQLAQQSPRQPQPDLPDSNAIFWQNYNKQARKQSELTESLYNSFGFESIISPWEQWMGAPGLIFPLWAGRYDNRLINYWLAESMLDLIRMYARWLYDNNRTAKGVVRALENYTIKTGFSYIATSKSGTTSVKKVQRFIDDFQTKNCWYERELDFFRRAIRDGEYFARLYAQEDGIAEVRIIEPEQVRQPDSSPEWLFGVRVPGKQYGQYDFEKILSYWVTWDGSIENGEEVPASEMVHQKRNTDISIRRGLSDFFCSSTALDGVQKLLGAGTSGEAVRQAIAYMRQFQQAPQPVVTALQTANTNFVTPIPTQTGAPNLMPTTVVVPGSVVDIPEGLEFQDGPKGNANNATAILEAAYQSLAAYWQVPVWIISGQTDANYASSLTAESPMVRNVEKEQKLFAAKYKEMIVKAIYLGVEQGLFSANVLDDVDIVVHVPPVVVRNALEETNRNALLNQNKLMSRRTWSDREELDFDHEQEQQANEQPGPEIEGKPTEANESNPHAQYQAAVQTDDTA